MSKSPISSAPTKVEPIQLTELLDGLKKGGKERVEQFLQPPVPQPPFPTVWASASGGNFGSVGNAILQQQMMQQAFTTSTNTRSYITGQVFPT